MSILHNEKGLPLLAKTWKHKDKREKMFTLKNVKCSNLCVLPKK